jgi:hypothetical protein
MLEVALFVLGGVVIGAAIAFMMAESAIRQERPMLYQLT